MQFSQQSKVYTEPYTFESQIECCKQEKINVMFKKKNVRRQKE